MATDPQQLLMALAGSTGLGQSIADNEQNQALQQQGAQQQLVLGQQQIAQNVAAQQSAQQFNQDVLDYNQDPTPQKLSSLAMRYPQQAQNFATAAKLKDDAQRNADLTSYGQLYNGANNGRADLVQQQLQQRQQAMRAAGQDTTNIDDAIQQLNAAGDDSDKQAAALKNIKGIALAQIYAHDPDGFSKAFQLKDDDGPDYTNTPQGNIYDKHTGLGPHGESYGYGGGGGPASGVAGGDGSAPGGDTSRLVNSDAGGGQVPNSVQTLGQFVTWGKALNAKGAKSSSAGTYQINGSTLAQFAPLALGPNWQSQPYNADSQDKVGKAIFDWAKQQPDPAAALAGRWVSLSKGQAAQLVKGSWDQAKGVIAQGETGGGAGASANAPSATAQGFGGLSGTAIDKAAAYFKSNGKLPGGIPKSDALHAYIINRAGQLPDNSADANGGLTQQALDYASDYSIHNGGKLPPGMGRTKGAFAAVENAVAARAAKAGLSAADVIRMGQDTSAAGKTLLGFSVGKQADAVRSLSVAIDHLGVLHDAVLALNNGNVQAFNNVSNRWAQATGSPLPTNAAAISQIVGDEVNKAVVGGNGGVTDREEIRKSLNPQNASPRQALGVINKYVALMAGQARGYQRQYEQGTGRSDFQRFLSPIAARNLGFGSGQGGRTGATAASPQVGAVVRGFRFNGGNPASPNSWARVQ